MSLTGGKRKVNKSLKAWVAFVKRVQKQEKLTYKDAIHRAKVRKDKGEKWMHGGDGCTKMLGDDSMKMGGRLAVRSSRYSGGTDRGVSRKIPRSGGKRSTAKKSNRKGKMTKKRRTSRH
jgi:hypothetical protein